jgi:DNA (cytosine-5)-methyltransferase 1
MNRVKSLELFSGAGGLATGLSLAGVDHIAFVEWDNNACNTLSVNYHSDIVHNVDIRDVDFSQFSDVDIIAGGPPCQPFSLGGVHKGNNDKRDMFPYAIKAIRKCLPQVFIFENVKGLLRKSFSKYFEYIILRLTYPEINKKEGETWEENLSTLEKIHTSGKSEGVKYNVVFRLINSADYGIPQQRERVFIVGIRNDLGLKWSFPERTHSLDSLLWSQFVDGDYWEKHQIKKVDTNQLNPGLLRRANNLKKKFGFFPPQKKSWKTVRDAIGYLPMPDKIGSFHSEHVLREGARIYPGHSGSYIDLPSKAIKAGVHGVPGGENMIRNWDGSVRYYTTFEAKKIQTFPDDYRITGSWTESMRQIGNAVPVELGYMISKSIFSSLKL